MNEPLQSAATRVKPNKNNGTACIPSENRVIVVSMNPDLYPLNTPIIVPIIIAITTPTIGRTMSF